MLAQARAPSAFSACLIDHYPTSTPPLSPTFTVRFPLCFCPREQCWRAGHGDEFPQGNLVSLCPQLPLPTGLGAKGALCMLRAGEEGITVIVMSNLRNKTLLLL